MTWHDAFGLTPAGVAVVVAIGLVLSLPAAFVGARRRARIRHEGIAEGERRERQRLFAASWSFAEDHATCEALQALANGQDLERVRAQWRARREAGGAA